VVVLSYLFLVKLAVIKLTKCFTTLSGDLMIVVLPDYAEVSPLMAACYLSKETNVCTAYITETKEH